MKTIFRNLAFGTTLAVFSALAAAPTFAQDVCAEVEPKQVLYKQFTDNFDKKEIEKRKTAITAGKQYVEKYGACEPDKAIVDYLNANLPGMEKRITTEEGDAVKQARYKRFNEAGQAKPFNTVNVYASGKEILANEPEFLDVIITLASAGFDEMNAKPTDNTYNEDVISFAKSAIQKIESGKTSSAGTWGFFGHQYQNEKYKDGKGNTLGAMNYFIGYTMYFRQGKDNPAKKKEALSYFYKSIQQNSFSKNDPTVYQAIGAWYLDEALKIDGVRTAAIKAAGDKDTEETLAMLGEQKGYAERAIDAYARSYKIAKDDKNQKKEYTDGLYSKLKDLYQFRYKSIDGIDAFVASVQSKPLPDPTTPITPVKEEPATTTTSTTNVTTPATTNTTKPAATTTTPTKPVSQTVTPTNVSTTATTTKPKPATKPAPKKKGTR